MKINPVFQRLVIIVCITLFLLGMSQTAVAQETTEIEQATAEIEQATADARRDAEQNVSPFAWASAGFVCGCLAPIYAYLINPEIPVGALLGKTPTYVATYTRVYQQNAKRQRIQSAVIGCAIGSAVSTAAYYLFVLPQLDTP